MHEFSKFLKDAPKNIRLAADRAFLGYPGNTQSAEDFWQDLIGNEPGNMKRVVALFSIIRSIVPDDVFNRLTGNSFVLQKDMLPIDPAQYLFEERKVGEGGECHVYRLASQDSGKPSLVIKIDQMRGATEKLLKLGTKLHNAYEEQKTWYAAIPDFVPDEYQFIARGPRGGERALFTIQEFFGDASKIQDLFDIPQDELLALLREDMRLAETFRLFASITVAQAEQHDRMIDTLGNKNVSLIDTQSGKRLILLDPHTTYHPSKEESIKRNALRSDLTYLKNTLTLLNTTKEAVLLVV
ncbi:MAG: hypothetical protein WAW00_03675 [Candidatus Moraniibacteriota bacterium]